jgi:hypothetical protein
MKAVEWAAKEHFQNDNSDHGPRPDPVYKGKGYRFIGERHYDVTVRFPPAARSSPEAIGSLVLTSSSGAGVISTPSLPSTLDRVRHSRWSASGRSERQLAPLLPYGA